MQDKNTILKVIEGDESAFAVLYRQLYQSLFFFVSKRVRDQELTRDIVQESFIRLWGMRTSLTPDRQVKTLLFTIAHNLTVDHFRKSGNYKTSFEDEAENLSFKDWSGSTEDESPVTEMVREVIDSFPDSVRSVFILSKYEGYKNAEIAEILGVSVKTVEARMTRLIKAVRNKLKNHRDLR